MGSLSFLQGIFPTQRLNPGLPHCTWILYQLIHQASPRILEWVAYPFSRGSSRPRNQTAVSCIAGGFFTNWAIRETLSYQNVQHLVYFCCNDVLKVITQERCMYMKYTLNVLASQLQRMGEATISLQWFLKFHFLETLLEYNCFPMWHWFPLSNFVNQLRVYTYPLPLEPRLPLHAIIYRVSLCHPFSQGKLWSHLWCPSCTVTWCNFTNKSHRKQKSWLTFFYRPPFSTWCSFGFRVPTSEIFNPCSDLLTLSHTCACVLSQFTLVRLFGTPWTVPCQAPLSMGPCRQEYRSGLPFPSPGDLHNIGIEPASPALAGGNSLPLSHQGSPFG